MPAEYYDGLTGGLQRPAFARSVANFTRPADTNAYTAGDAVNNSTSAPVCMKFANVARVNGGQGKIVRAIIECNFATVTNGTFRLHLFTKTFTPSNDNAAFAVLHANAVNYLGTFDFPTLVADSSSAAAAQSQQSPAVSATGFLPLEFACDSGDSAIYGALVATGAYTPSSAEVFNIILVIEEHPQSKRV